MHVPAETKGPAIDEATAAFLVASRALVGVAAASLAELDDITLPQFRALVLLSTRGPTTVGRLAAALDVHSSTTTRLCDRLVGKRLVRRTRGRTDRRATNLALTTAGRRTVEQVTERRRRAIAAAVARMTAPQRAAATAALTAFAQAAGEASPADPFGWAADAPGRTDR
jgi:DNA-binding MarR family transcriptional regulator